MAHPRPHPDLTYPLLPDAEEDLPLPLSHASPISSASASANRRQLDQGGMNLRESDNDVLQDYQWPESGPSSKPMNSSTPPDVGGDSSEPRVGPFGAKAVAAMTGAMVTSLLMTPFDVLKTRLQTVQPHPRAKAAAAATAQQPPFNPISAAAGSECCQTTMLTSTSSSSRLPPPPTSNPLTCLSSTSASAAASSASSSATVRQNVTLSSVRPATTPTPAPSGCLHPSKWSGIWGEAITFEQALARGVIGSAHSGGAATGAGGGALLVFPSASQAVSREAASSTVTRAMAPGFWSEIAAVRQETGVRGLWKGVGTAITMGIPSSAIYMLGYEHLLTVISPYFTGTSDPALNASSLSADPSAVAAAAAAAPTSSLTAATQVASSSRSVTTSLTPAPLIAGSLARTLSATVISPIEMFRTRLQALPSVDRGSPTYASTARDMSQLVKSKGVTILWRGLGPTLWRDVPFSGIYWASFELLKSLLTSNSSPLPPLSPISTSFISGFISGTISALVTQPFDVLKTRRQTEGIEALFAGMSARVGKVAPACGLMIACYEGVGRWLGGAPGAKRAL